MSTLNDILKIIHASQQGGAEEGICFNGDQVLAVMGSSAVGCFNIDADLGGVANVQAVIATATVKNALAGQKIESITGINVEGAQSTPISVVTQTGVKLRLPSKPISSYPISYAFIQNHAEQMRNAPHVVTLPGSELLEAAKAVTAVLDPESKQHVYTQYITFLVQEGSVVAIGTSVTQSARSPYVPISSGLEEDSLLVFQISRKLLSSLLALYELGEIKSFKLDAVDPKIIEVTTDSGVVYGQIIPFASIDRASRDMLDMYNQMIVEDFIDTAAAKQILIPNGAMETWAYMATQMVNAAAFTIHNRTRLEVRSAASDPVAVDHMVDINASDDYPPFDVPLKWITKASGSKAFLLLQDLETSSVVAVVLIGEGKTLIDSLLITVNTIKRFNVTVLTPDADDDSGDVPF